MLLMKNPNDAQQSLSILRNSRWRPIWPPFQNSIWYVPYWYIYSTKFIINTFFPECKHNISDRSYNLSAPVYFFISKHFEKLKQPNRPTKNCVSGDPTDPKSFLGIRVKNQKGIN